jgi:hypothetical protein
MIVKLIKQLLAIVMAMALVGAPAVRAAVTAPCHNVVASAYNNQLQSDQTSVPASVPRNGMTLACATVLHYGLNASLPVQS